MNIGRRIYYELETGNVIVDTGERMGDVTPTTVEQDYDTYADLREYFPYAVGHIDLPYGEYKQDFMECTSYRVDPETKLLQFSYPDPNAPEEPPVYQKPLTEQVEELKNELSLVKTALDDMILYGGGF